MKNFFGLIKISNDLGFNFKLNAFFLIIASFIEVFTISMFLPLVYLVTDFNSLADFVNKYNFFEFELDKQNYKFLVLIIISIFIIGSLLVYALRYLSSFNLNQFHAKISKNLFQIFIENDYQYIVNQKTSEIYNLVSSETNRFCNGLIKSLFELISKFFVFLLILIGLFLYNFQVTLISLVLGSVLYFSIYFVFRSYVKKFNNTINTITTKDNNFLRTGTNAILELRIFSMAQNFLKSYKENLKKKNQYTLILDTIKNSPKIIIELFIIITFCLFVLHDNEIINNNLTKISVFIVAFYKLFPTLNAFFNYFVTFKSHEKSAQIIQSMFKDRTHRNDDEQIEYIKKINLKNINFSYQNSKKNILNNFNLEINQGDKVAILGETGSGKTTILHLLLGILTIKDGGLFLNNKKFETSYLSSYMKKISYINQNPFFFEESIFYNICLKKDLTESELLKLENINNTLLQRNFLNKLDLDLQTKLESNGLNLSAGQRQRINLARGIFKENSIIFMDEPTSSLDYQTEDLILKDVFENKLIDTCVVCTHRKGILKYCNKIIEL